MLGSVLALPAWSFFLVGLKSENYQENFFYCVLICNIPKCYSSYLSEMH